MKKLFTVLFFTLLPLLSTSAQTAQQLNVTNLMVMYRPGRALPDGTKEGNSLEVSVSLQNVFLASRLKITVMQKSTNEILEVKTINFSEKDGIVFYTSHRYSQPIKGISVSDEVSIGTLTQADVVVEVYAVDKQNKVTQKLKQ